MLNISGRAENYPLRRISRRESSKGTVILYGMKEGLELFYKSITTLNTDMGVNSCPNSIDVEWVAVRSGMTM